MIPITDITGRLGNQMFEFAFLYAQTKDMGVDWYVQDEKYFKKYQKDIKQLFGQGIPKQTNMVAIHVRRGDYVGNKFYVDLSKTDYYERAMAYFPNESFLIFSDDPYWCEEHFKDNNMEIVYEKDEIKSMNLMASCKGIIMANSSYSWWASFLSDAKVIAPKAWYTDGNQERTKCLDTWTRI